MKKVSIFIMIIAVLIIASCGKNSSEYKALKAQNDSLLLADAQNQAELEEIVAIFNEIEENLASIKEAENYLNVQSNTPGELTPSVKKRVRSDIQFVADVLIKNKDKITELESKLKKSSLKSGQLQKTVDGLRTELENKTKNLVALSTELKLKDEQIANLTANVSALAKDVEDLRSQSDEQRQIIKAQRQELSTVYYCYGTSKELKEQQIIKQGQLNPTFNKDYFIKVKNRNELKIIPLLAKKAELLSKHPAGSYELVTDSDKKTELHILDVETFWSLTKYLVVRVNV